MNENKNKPIPKALKLKMEEGANKLKRYCGHEAKAFEEGFQAMYELSKPLIEALNWYKHQDDAFKDLLGDTVDITYKAKTALKQFREDG